MKKRKTYEIEKLIEKANKFFLDTKDSMKEERKSLFMFVADILHDTGNYNGFNYLYKEDMKNSSEGYSIGINSDPDRPYLPHEDYNERFKDTDDSRVFLYYSRLFKRIK